MLGLEFRFVPLDSKDLNSFIYWFNAELSLIQIKKRDRTRIMNNRTDLYRACKNNRLFFLKCFVSKVAHAILRKELKQSIFVRYIMIAI